MPKQPSPQALQADSEELEAPDCPITLRKSLNVAKIAKKIMDKTQSINRPKAKKTQKVNYPKAVPYIEATRKDQLGCGICQITTDATERACSVCGTAYHFECLAREHGDCPQCQVNLENLEE